MTEDDKQKYFEEGYDQCFREVLDAISCRVFGRGDEIEEQERLTLAEIERLLEKK